MTSTNFADPSTIRFELVQTMFILTLLHFIPANIALKTITCTYQHEDRHRAALEKEGPTGPSDDERLCHLAFTDSKVWLFELVLKVLDR